MPTPTKILLIDHDECDIDTLEYMLQKDYLISSLDDSEKVVERATCIRPNIVIVNPEMPNLPIKALCDKLKTLRPPSSLLFLSSTNTIELCMEAYENGADDFILKPFNPIEIHEKIRVLTRNIAIKQKLEMASETARVAMENSFELGTIITFMESMGACTDYDELSLSFFNAIEDFGLSGSLQIRGSFGSLNFRCANDSLDATILSDYQGEKKTIEQPQKMIIHHNNISVILRDLPSPESMKYGRLKDHLCIMVNSTVSRVTSLALQMELEEKREFGVEETLKMTSTIKEKFQQSYALYQSNADSRVSDFGQQMEAVFFSLSLDYQQEELLLDSMRSLLLEMSDSTALKTMLNKNIDELLHAVTLLLGDQ
ncbi:hypothetical protein A9Q99_04695 [Gammaproteobacteria bacterium 45_16_T64]|nr:hypothetical protein A9Q99_04695 [Gammaproteobacteria bacterium 45_16_T64]